MELWPFVADIWANDVAKYFSLAVCGVFLLSILGMRLSPLAEFGRHGAALCTTLGVLGTFTGIFLGLLEFDVAKIDASVPHLLAGLKIAFSTSIVGMAGAVLLRVVEPLVPAPAGAVSETSPEAIHQTLRQIDDTISRSSERQAAAMAEVRSAISADNDSSLFTQTQRLRISVEDGNRELIGEFKQFAQTMAENNSRALIEALEGVVRDFNTQLNEQFGENFKQLNQAVGALLEWQERYRSHVEILEERIEAAVTALQTSEAALSGIRADSTKIHETHATLQTLLAGFSTTVGALERSLRDQGAATEELNAHLEAVAGLKDRSMDAFPTIERNIALLTENLTGTVDAHTQTINNSANAMQEQHRVQLSQVQELIGQQFQAFDQQMQQELTRVLETMGQQLASLSEKFAYDYEPITQRLRELLDAVDRGTTRTMR